MSQSTTYLLMKTAAILLLMVLLILLYFRSDWHGPSDVIDLSPIAERRMPNTPLLWQTASRESMALGEFDEPAESEHQAETDSGSQDDNEPEVPSPAKIHVETTQPRYRSHDLAMHRGRIVYFNFWAYWCAPCLQELPYLNQLAKEFSGDELVVYLVNMDTDEELKRQGQEFLIENAITLIQVVKDKSNLLREFSPGALPYHVLIDQQGRIAAEFYGSVIGAEDKLRGWLQQLQAEAYPSE